MEHKRALILLGPWATSGWFRRFSTLTYLLIYLRGGVTQDLCNNQKHKQCKTFYSMLLIKLLHCVEMGRFALQLASQWSMSLWVDVNGKSQSNIEEYRGRSQLDLGKRMNEWNRWESGERAIDHRMFGHAIEGFASKWIEYFLVIKRLLEQRRIPRFIHVLYTN